MRTLKGSLNQTELQAVTEREERLQREREQKEQEEAGRSLTTTRVRERMSDLLDRMVKASSENRGGSSMRVDDLAPRILGAPKVEDDELLQGLVQVVDEFERSLVLWYQAEAQSWEHR